MKGDVSSERGAWTWGLWWKERMSDAKGLGGRKHMVLGEPKEDRQPGSKKARETVVRLR